MIIREIITTQEDIAMSKLEKAFLTEREVAELGIRSRQALRNDRWLGRGLPFYRVGRSVRYLKKDVAAYLKRNRVKHDS